MILLNGTSESLTITTTATSYLDITVSYADITTTTFVPGATSNTIGTASANAALVGAPLVSTQRQIKLITLVNRDPTVTNTVVIKKLVTATYYSLTPVVTLLAGESMQYIDGQGWKYYAVTGATKGNQGAAGSDPQVQYNSSGILAGDADFVWDNTNQRLGIGTSTKTGALTLGGGTTDQAAPAAGTIHIYTKDVASKMVPKWIGPSGIDNPIQPGIGFNGIKQVAPATGTTGTTCMSVFATAITNSASSYANVPVSSGSIKTRMRSVTLTSATTAGSIATHFTSQYEVIGEGGYFFVTRFYVGNTLGTGQRGFHGLAGKLTAMTNLDWTNESSLVKVGLAYSLTGTAGNWKVVASTAAVMPAIDTGIAVNNTDVMELVLFCAPGGTSIGYRVTNITTGTTTSGTATGNVPAATVALGVHHFATNNATSGAVILGLNKWYLESDY